MKRSELLVKRKRIIAFMIVLVMLITLFLSACGKTDKEVGSSTNSKNAETKEPDKSQPPVKLTMFMGDAGTKVPTDVDPGDNHIIRIVEELANVDLEVTKPEYMDFKTKFNLMMSSGEVLDIVHASFPEDVKKYGREGAFIALDDIIAKSPTLSVFHTEKDLNTTRADDGKLYALFARQEPSADHGGFVVRLDLIDKFNQGKTPATPDDWYELAKKVKQEYPDSTPFSSQGNLNFMTMFFSSYGVTAGGWQLTNEGKVISSFESPNLKKAVEFYRKLYSEGLIDPDFITNKYEDFMVNRIPERNVVCLWGGHWAIYFAMEEWIKKGELSDKYIGYAPLPIAPEVKEEDALKLLPASNVGFHSISISSKCKDKDAAVRTLEAFCGPEIKYAAGWGVEGIEFNMKNGKEELDIKTSKEKDWRIIYGFMWQYWYDEHLGVKNNTLLADIDDEGYKKKFFEDWDNGMGINARWIRIAGPNPFEGMVLSSDITSRVGEADADSLSIILKAIVGQISMEEFDKQAAAYVEKYNFLTEARQEWYDKNRR